MLFCSEIIIHQKKGETLIFMEKIDNFLVYVLMYDHVYIREYTGISRQTNARAPIVRTIVIARTVLAALVGSSCYNPMSWFSWYLTAGIFIFQTVC